MKQKFGFRMISILLAAGCVFLIAGATLTTAAPLSGVFTPNAVIDQNDQTPLENPVPTSYEPRYLSGFGMDNSFTVFFEDRNLSQRISYVRTTSGPTGFPAAPTATNITDTHFVVKNWPYPDSGAVQYLYRGWGSVDNIGDHHFYGSNDLTNWTLISTFPIPIDTGFTNARGTVYYGFHDVIRIPIGTGYHYYAWGESNQGQTQLVYSDTGGDTWTAISSVGGTNVGDGPLMYPESATPSGSFFDLGHDRGYGKLQVRGNDSGLYLAVNSEAQSSLSPAAFEAAFINPSNWTWHDGSTGVMSTPLLSETGEHDYREAWLVPHSDPDASWVGIYDANYGAADGDLALGHFEINPEAFTAAASEPETLPETGFSRRKPAQDFDASRTDSLAEGGELVLKIPDLSLEMDIVGVPQTGGTWDVRSLGDNVGYLYGTAFPTWAGNTLLTGHVWDANNQPGPFADLKKLRYGDQVMINAWGQIYTYEIRESFIALPNRIDKTLQHEDYDWVTLVTCELYNPFGDDYVFRRVVRAVLVDVSTE